MYEAPPSPPASPPRQRSPLNSLKKNKSPSSKSNGKSSNPKKELTKTKSGTGNYSNLYFVIIVISFNDIIL